MYQLKKGVESFEVVDGAFAGKKFLRGRVYAAIPPEEAKKFEKIEDRKQETGKSKEVTAKNKETEKSKEEKPIS